MTIKAPFQLPPGMSDNWLYLDFIHRPEVRRWPDEHDLNLGNSDEPATYWLIADALTGDLYAAPQREATVARRKIPMARLFNGAGSHELMGTWKLARSA